MSNNTKERVEALQRAARALLEEFNVDIHQAVDLRALGKIFSERHDCHYETARRHIARAARLARGEATKKRGGLRNPSGGRPRKNTD